MFTGKRLFFSLGFLFLIIIMVWVTWYFTIVRPKLIAEPVMRDNTKLQIATDDTVDAAVIKKSPIVENTQENDTSKTHKRPKAMSQSGHEGIENATSLRKQKESDSLTHHPDESNDHNHKDLSVEKMEEARKYIETVRNELNEFEARINELKKHSEIRNTELANHLNTLSAKEQQAYFDNIRSGKVLEKMPPNFFESARVNMQSKDYSEEAIDEVLGLFKQEGQNFASEAGAKRHLEKLKKYGFEPKF